MPKALKLNRRQFVVSLTALGAGMVVGVRPALGKASDGATAGEINAWLSITAEGAVVLRTPKVETGNGTQSTLVLMLCEELGCRPDAVTLEVAEIHRDLAENKVYSGKGGALTWFSGRAYQLRGSVQQAGASARERLKMAAATRWNVPFSEVIARDNAIEHPPSGRKAGYGELAAAAAAVRLSAEPAIKAPDAWELAGKTSIGQRSTPRKIDGSGIYGIDVQVPGMLYAAIKQAPVQSARLRSFDAEAVKAMPGVVSVIAIGPNPDRTSSTTRLSRLHSAVVITARHYWQAKKALDALPVEWDEGSLATISSETIRQGYKAKLDQSGKQGRQTGDMSKGMSEAAIRIEAVYEAPYQEHATMEPLNATAHYTPDRLDLWVSTQNLETALKVAAEESGLAPEKIFLHPMMVGGQFGRRNPADEIRQAVAVAMAVRQPVKLIWSREETVQQGAYRPNAMTRFNAGLKSDGLPTTWFVRQVGHSYELQLDPAFDGFDVIAMRPIQTETDYVFENSLVEFHAMLTHVRVNSFRGSGATFQVESFIDEIAHAGGRDPVELRRWLLREAKDPGWLRVLDEVARKSNWGKKLPKGRAQGMAINIDHGTITAQVAEVSVSKEGQLTVHSIDVAFDVGNVVNPDGVRAQMIGGVIFGLSNTLHEEITLENGRVVQSNFHDYPVLRIGEVPEIRVHFGGNTGGTKFEACGETPVPPVAPAVCNAIFRATGKRVRSLPLKNHDLSWS